MRRAVWVGCFFGIALIGSIEDAQSKITNLKCELDHEGNKSVANITINDKDNSVQINIVFIDKTVDIRHKFKYVDGAYGKAHTWGRIKSLDGRNQNYYNSTVDEYDKSHGPNHQRVIIQGNKIQFGAEGGRLNAIDMGAGGIYTSHSGKKGVCDYAD